MANKKFNFEVSLKYKNYCGEEIDVGVIGKFRSKMVADFFATSYEAELSKDEKDTFYCVVVEK